MSTTTGLPAEVTQVSFDAVEIWWVDDYYDMPLTGVGALHGEEVYFHADTFDETEGSMRYDIYRLTDEQRAYEHARHEDFVKMVGNYWDWRVPREQRGYNYSDKDGFYAKYHDAEKHDLSKATLVARAQ